MQGKIEGRRRGGQEDEVVGWHHQLNGHELGKLQEIVKDREAWHVAVCGVARAGHDLETEQQPTDVCVYIYTHIYVFK